MSIELLVYGGIALVGLIVLVGLKIMFKQFKWMIFIVLLGLLIFASFGKLFLDVFAHRGERQRVDDLQTETVNYLQAKVNQFVGN